VRVSKALVWLPVLAVAFSGGCESQRSSTPKPVFLIVVDTLRPDRLSCYGYEDHVTPNIDRIAGAGVLFERVQSAASWTVPSMGSMMTSRYPTQLGLIEKPLDKEFFTVRERRPQIRYTRSQSAVTLAEILRENGYSATAFVNQPFINAHDGFIQGFDAWCFPDLDGATWHDLSTPMPSQTRLPLGMEGGQADSLIIGEFTRWMKEAPVSDSTLVWIHLLRPHSPYIPPARYIETGNNRASAMYDGEIRCNDDEVGRVLDVIDERFGLDNVIVVFTSDHGEEFGEHGGSEHGHTLHSEVTQVPLIVRAPGVDPSRIACPVRTIDIAPTVLDLIGIDAPSDFEGESLLPLLQGACADRPAYAEGMLYAGTEQGLLANGLRLMYDSEREEPFSLFDSRTDPQEMENILNHNKTEAQSMREDLDRLRERLALDLYADVSEDDSNEGESERVLNSLRALGYIK
jgi:arylsulfatase A-like enzyme